MDQSSQIKNPATITEEQKRLDNYLHSEVDYTIALCNDSTKKKIKKAYDLRNGVRDNEEFEYLWKAYGIEFPSQMRHVPVLKSMFDALVGQERLSSLNYTITSKDPDVLKTISNKKKKKIINEIRFRLKKNLQENLDYVNKQQQLQGVQSQPKDYLSDQEISKLEQELKEWKSDLEIKNQELMTWLIQTMRLKFHFGTFLDDLICAGGCYYQVKPVQIGRRPLFRVINPLGLFHPDDPNIRFIKHHERVCYKETMSVTTIYRLYGHKMKDADRIRFETQYQDFISSGVKIDDGRLLEHQRKTGGSGMEIPVEDVYYCEWKANNKVEWEDEDLMIDGKTLEATLKKTKKHKYKLDLYEGIRIGEDIYVDCGKSKYAQRPFDDPSDVYLSINGLAYNDRNGKPYSLVLNTKDLADKIDIFHYHAETAVALSGGKAALVNFPDIPIWLGADPMQRLMAWKGLVKQGLAAFDTSQEGDGAGKFTNFGDIDLSLDQSVKIIFEMIGALEETASKITGVPRQMIGQLAERDGKAVTEIAMTRSTIVTQPLFAVLNEVQREALTDLLNVSSVCYQEGLNSSYRDDSGKTVPLTIEPGELNESNDVFISDSGEENETIQRLQSIAPELIANQMIDIESFVDLFTIKSLTKLKQKIVASARKKQEDNTASFEDQIKQYQAELEKLQRQLGATQGNDGMAMIKQAELQLKDKDIEVKRQLKEQELAITDNFNQAKIAEGNKRVELEALQLAYSSNAKEVKDR